MALSRRAEALSKPDPAYLFRDILANTWDSKSNPDGFVHLGLAENTLMHDVLNEHLHKHLAVPTSAFTYGDGGKRVKSAIAKFICRYMKPLTPVLPVHITLANGCSSAVEQLSWALANPGDVFILGRPFYGTFVPDITLRMGTELVTVPFGELDPLCLNAVQCYENVIKETQSLGKRVAALLLCNPHNPLGRCYPRKVILEIMKLCQRHGIHLISDEIYALSIFENQVDEDQSYEDFESCLAIDVTEIKNPSLLHVVWGMSKDFGANGLRFGAIISQHHAGLHRSILPGTLYASTSLVSEHIVANVLEDEAWVEAYIGENRKRLSDSHASTALWAREHGIEYAQGVNAAFFLWVNLGSKFPDSKLPNGSSKSDAVAEALLREKVFLASGVQFGSERDGWFRIVFTHQPEYLREGLRRIAAALCLR